MTGMDIVNLTFADFPTLAQMPLKALACYFGAGLLGCFFIRMASR